MSITIRCFFEPSSGALTYVIHKNQGSSCAIIDPVLNYDHSSGRIDYHSANEIITYIKNYHLSVEWILETHAHADHLTAAAYLKKKLGGKTGIGAQITTVQKNFHSLFHLEDTFKLDGSQFDHLFVEGEQFKVGDLIGNIIFVPGHTPDCIAYQFANNVFVGDTLFMPDLGTARCDFPGGSAQILYHSIQKILDLHPKTRLLMCHDYPKTREMAFESTVADQKANNIHINQTITEAEFIEMRNKRDQTLGMPQLIFPAIQLNIRAGELPPKENNNIAYFKIPINGM